MEKFISDMLKQRRLETNLSQEQLADRAHLLIHCNNLEYHPDPANQLEFEETLLIEEFMKTIMGMMKVFDCVEQEDRHFFIDKYDEEIKYLNKDGFYIYGSCNDTLVNAFKYTKLVFVKI